MKVRTLDELTDRLSEELVWRKRELAAIRALVEAGAIQPARKEFLIRAGVALLYAHFEGFVKEAGNLYLNFVKSQQLPNSQLRSNFQALIFKELIPISQGKARASSLANLVDFVDGDMEKRSNIGIKGAIDTESNLSAKVLKEIVWILGLDYAPFSPKEHLIDGNLLYQRNHIAHGNYLVVDQPGYLDLHAQVVEMLENFNDQIEQNAANRLYARSQNGL